MKSILDPSFQYTPSTQTDLRKTFKRIRREMKLKEQEAAKQAVVQITLAKNFKAK